MARIRSIKPEITLDEDLADLGFAARYFFLNLWCHCDREGRCEDRPRKLQALILPWDPEISADVILNELAPKFLVRYEVAGKRYLQVLKFSKHQRPHPTETKSEIPPPDEKSAKPVIKTAKHVGSTLKQAGKGEGEGEGKGGCIVPAPTGAAKKERVLTPSQKVIRGFKEAKGIDANDKEWDRKFAARYAKSANELLVSFNGDADKAIVYILVKGEEWKHLTDWGLEAIVKAAGREYIRIWGGSENGSEHQPVVNDRLDGPRSTGRFTSSGSLAGDALRSLEQARIPAEAPGDMGGDEPDYSGDED